MASRGCFELYQTEFYRYQTQALNFKLSVYKYMLFVSSEFA